MMDTFTINLIRLQDVVASEYAAARRYFEHGHWEQAEQHQALAAMVSADVRKKLAARAGPDRGHDWFY